MVYILKPWLASFKARGVLPPSADRPVGCCRYTYDDGAVARHRGAKVLGGVCRVHKERAHAFMAVKPLAARPRAGPKAPRADSFPGRAISSPGWILPGPGKKLPGLDPPRAGQKAPLAACASGHVSVIRLTRELQRVVRRSSAFVARKHVAERAPSALCELTISRKPSCHAALTT